MDHTVVVIGNSFGGCMTALPLASKFKKRNKNETILMPERGTFVYFAEAFLSRVTVSCLLLPGNRVRLP